MRHFRVLPAQVLIAIIGLVLCTVANADPVPWTLGGVQFGDGGAASGSFTYDADTDTLTSWNIAVTAGVGFEACVYTDSTALPSAPPMGDTQFTFASPCPDENRTLRLDTFSPLTNAGGMVGLQTVETLGPNSRTTSEGSLTASPPPPLTALAVEKVFEGISIDADDSGDVSVGDTLAYTITATNTGTANLNGVRVSDDLTNELNICAGPVLPAETCVLNTTYVVTAADAATGLINNVGMAVSEQTATDPVTDPETVPVPNPALAVVKAFSGISNDADGSGNVSAGDTLAYTITATNTGAANLTNVVVSDNLTGANTTCAGPVPPAGTCVLNTSYVVTMADATAGVINNTSTADSDQTAPVTATATVPVSPPPPPPPRRDTTSVGLRVPRLNTVSDPVVLTTGAYTFAQELIRGPGSLMPFSFVVFYNSSEQQLTPLGRKWTHSYNWKLEDLGGGEFRVKHGDGAADYYQEQGGQFTPQDPGVFETLVQNGDGTFTYENLEGDRFNFSPDGELTSIVDSNNNTFQLAHNANGLLETVMDASGKIATFSYNPDGRVIAVNYAGLIEVTFTYDSAGDLVMFTEPGNLVTTFTYDAAGNLLTGDASGVQFVTNTYDAGGRVFQQQDAKGAESEIVYMEDANTMALFTDVIDRLGNVEQRDFDSSDRLSSMIDALNAQYSYEYDANGDDILIKGPIGDMQLQTQAEKTFDARGNLRTLTDALGHTMTFTYDASDNVTSVTDPFGKTEILTYDAADNLESETDPLGHTTSSTFTQAGIKGLVASRTDENGHITTHTYTPQGNLETLTDPLGGTLRVAYDGLGRITSIADANQNTYQFGYNTAGRNDSYTDPLGAITRFTYDPLGQLESEIDPDGATTQYSHTPTGEIASVTDPLGFVRTFESDAENRPTAYTNPAGLTTRYEWSARGELLQTTDALNGTATATYDLAGNRTSVTDPNGNTTTFAHDALGRITRETNPLGNFVTNAFDARGQVASLTNARDQMMSFQYDDAGRRQETKWSDGTTVEFDWDPVGNLTALLRNGGATTSLTYDPNNEITSRTDEFGNTVQYEYDLAGNIVELTYSDGKAVRYRYDALNRLVEVRDWADRVTTYSYDAVGTVSSKRLPDGSTVNYRYDAARRLTSMRDAAANGSTIYRANFTLDKAGLKTQEQVQLPLWPTGPTTALTPVNRPFSYNAANQLTEENGQFFDHDADGNLTDGTIAGAPTTLTYNEVNQITQVQEAGGAREDSYEYDAAGLRIEATIAGKTTRYVWDVNSDYFASVLEEHDSNGTITARYVYGLGLISREAADGSVSVYHYDSRGITLALTNLAGEITDRYAYDPYGRIVRRTGATPNPFTYNGRDGVIDDGNGVYFMRMRAYVPSLMQFAQAEAIIRGTLMRPASLNRYAFVNGNPIDLVDPTGDNPLLAAVGIGAGVGALTGGGGQIASNVVSGACHSGGSPVGFNCQWDASKDGVFYNVPGAVVGGAVSGGLDVFAIAGGPFGLAASGAVGAAAGNGVNQALNIYVFHNQDKFNTNEFVTEVAVGGLTGGITGGLGKYASDSDGLVGLLFGDVKRSIPGNYFRAARPAKLFSNLIVKGSRLGADKANIGNSITKTTKKTGKGLKKTGKKIGKFFSSGKKGKGKRFKAKASRVAPNRTPSTSLSFNPQRVISFGGIRGLIK